MILFLVVAASLACGALDPPSPQQPPCPPDPPPLLETSHDGRTCDVTSALAAATAETLREQRKPRTHRRRRHRQRRRRRRGLCSPPLVGIAENPGPVRLRPSSERSPSLALARSLPCSEPGLETLHLRPLLRLLQFGDSVRCRWAALVEVSDDEEKKTHKTAGRKKKRKEPPRRRIDDTGEWLGTVVQTSGARVLVHWVAESTRDGAVAIDVDDTWLPPQDPRLVVLALDRVSHRNTSPPAQPHQSSTPPDLTQTPPAPSAPSAPAKETPPEDVGFHRTLDQVLDRRPAERTKDASPQSQPPQLTIFCLVRRRSGDVERVAGILAQREGANIFEASYAFPRGTSREDAEFSACLAAARLRRVFDEPVAIVGCIRPLNAAVATAGVSPLSAALEGFLEDTSWTEVLYEDNPANPLIRRALLVGARCCPGLFDPPEQPPTPNPQHPTTGPQQQQPHYQPLPHAAPQQPPQLQQLGQGCAQPQQQHQRLSVRHAKTSAATFNPTVPKEHCTSCGLSNSCATCVQRQGTHQQGPPQQKQQQPPQQQGLHQQQQQPSQQGPPAPAAPQRTRPSKQAAQRPTRPSQRVKYPDTAAPRQPPSPIIKGPTSRNIPAHMKDPLSRVVASIVGSYPAASDSEKESIFVSFLLIPSTCLLKISGPTRYRNRELSKALAGATSDLAARTRATLDPLTATATIDVSATPGDDDEEDDGLLNISTSNTKAAVALARQHYLSRAVERLMRSGGVIEEEDLVAQLEALHPTGTSFPASPPQPPQNFVALEVEDVRKAVAKACSGKSPGPSGWTEELLRDACSFPVVAQAITAMLADIMAGNVSANVRDLLTDCALIGIPKPDGSVRPIAMGEVLLKLAGTLAVTRTLPVLRSTLQPLGQYGLEEGGCERIVHAVRALASAEQNAVVVTIDCANAFNTVARNAMAAPLYSDQSLHPLWALFRLSYCSPSRLLYQRKKGDKSLHVIPSTSGGRQGDSIMPALFCLAMAPVLKDIARFHGVRVFAYLDDVTVVGPPDATVAAVAEIVRRLASITLRVNTSKCEVFSNNQAAAAFVATTCGFRHQPNGIKVLGAFIGEANATAQHLEGKRLKHETFFEAIKRVPVQRNGKPDMRDTIPPDVSFALLAYCGVPRWVFLCRTHEPSPANTECTARFDSSVREAFCSVAGIPPGALSSDQLILLHLPRRVGGLGVTAWLPHHKGAYESSLDPTSDDQAARALEVNMQLLASLPAGIRHLAGINSRARASAWLDAVEVKASNDFRGFVASLQMRLAWTPLPAASVCSCGLRFSGAALEQHLLGCTRTKINGPARRHNAVTRCIRECCQELGIPATWEPMLEGRKRADLEIFFSSGPLLVDVTVNNPLAKSHVGKSQGEIEAAAVKSKQKKYDALGAECLTVQLEGTGGIGTGALLLLRRIAQEAGVETPPLIRQVSKTLMVGSGLIVALHRRDRWRNIASEPPTQAAPTDAMSGYLDVELADFDMAGERQQNAAEDEEEAAMNEAATKTNRRDRFAAGSIEDKNAAHTNTKHSGITSCGQQREVLSPPSK